MSGQNTHLPSHPVHTLLGDRSTSPKHFNASLFSGHDAHKDCCSTFLERRRLRVRACLCVRFGWSHGTALLHLSDSRRQLESLSKNKCRLKFSGPRRDMPTRPRQFAALRRIAYGLAQACIQYYSTIFCEPKMLARPGGAYTTHKFRWHARSPPHLLRQ